MNKNRKMSNKNHNRKNKKVKKDPILNIGETCD